MSNKVYHERAVRVLERRMRRQDGVVWLNDGVRHGGCGVHAELELRLLAIVGGKTLEDEGTEPGASTTAKRVEDKEALKTTAVVRKAANLVHHSVDHLLTHCVVTTGV